MESNRQMNDWILRYGFLLKKRNSDKQKDKFIQAYLSDILTIRNDIHVKEIEVNKRKYHNIYIGDVSKADKIITTYFDTPIVSFGDYSFKDFEKNQKNTLVRIAIESILAILLGVTLYFFISSLFEEWLLTILLAIFALVFFYLFSGIVKGRASGKTQVRNTSSLIEVLNMLEKYKKNKNVAFALVDGGCTNRVGLIALCRTVKTNSTVISLDCVGADEKLTVEETLVASSNVKVLVVRPQKDYLNNKDLSKNIDSDSLNYQCQEIETILEERTCKF